MIAVTVDRRACRLAPLERSKSLGRRRYARFFEPHGSLFERERRASLEQGHEEQTVVIRVRAGTRVLDSRYRDSQGGAVRVAGVRHSVAS